MKRWMMLLLTLCLSAILCLPVAADMDTAQLYMLDSEAEEYLTAHATEDGVFPRVADIADLLTDDEEDSLAYTIADIAEDFDFDVVILTVDGLDGKTPEAYADDFFDYGGYGVGTSHDGVLFMFNVGDRDWWVSTTGYGIAAFTDYGIDYVYNEIAKEYIAYGDYAEGFEACLDTTKDFLRAANDGTAYDVGNTYMGYEMYSSSSSSSSNDEPELIVKKVLISLGVSVVIAWAIVSMMKKSMKTVHMQPMAGTYVKNGSFILSQQSDVFLYSHVSQVVRQTSSGSGGGGGGSSTHFGSSGISHGGGGGKL